MKGYVQDGGGPKDSENTLNSFLTKTNRTVFWQIGTDMVLVRIFVCYYRAPLGTHEAPDLPLAVAPTEKSLANFWGSLGVQNQVPMHLLA